MKHAKAPDNQVDELQDLDRLQAELLGYPYQGHNGPGSNPPTIDAAPGGRGWTTKPTEVEDDRDDPLSAPKGKRLGVSDSLLDTLDKKTDDDLLALPKVAALGFTKQRIARLRAVARSAT